MMLTNPGWPRNAKLRDSLKRMAGSAGAWGTSPKKGGVNHPNQG